MCFGDDFMDEDMFCSFNGLFGMVINVDYVYIVIVGVSIKVILVKWYFLEF